LPSKIEKSRANDNNYFLKIPAHNPLRSNQLRSLVACAGGAALIYSLKLFRFPPILAGE
jgi:hypothetical protein